MNFKFIYISKMVYLQVMLLALVSSAQAQVVLSGGLTVTDQQLNEIKQRLPKLQQNKNFYHWTSIKNGVRWISQGYIDHGEMSFINTSGKSNQVYGAGLYLSENDENSKAFGQLPLIFEIKKGTPIYDENIILDILQTKLNNDQSTDLGKAINFIRLVNNKYNWWITHQTNNVNDIKFSLKTKMTRPLVAKDVLINSNDASTRWVKSFLHLIYYVDGISLMRAINVNPNNPWAEFENENFDKFAQLREEFLTNNPNKAINWSLTQNETMDEWAHRQIYKEMKYLYQRLNATDKYEFRKNPINAGGTLDKKQFYASPKELYHLLQNEYLHVNYEVAGDKSGFLVTYDYPSVEHWKQIEYKLSRGLVSELNSKNSPNDELNQLIIKELLTEMFLDIKQKGFSRELFIQKFISIHPFSDTNGRISRLYTEEVMFSAGIIAAPMFLSDLDILTSTNNFKEINKSSKEAYTKLETQIIIEYLTSISAKKMPQYYDLPAWKGLASSLSIFGIESLTLDNEDYDPIRQRRFNYVFNKHFGQGWSFVADDDSREIIKLALKYRRSEYISGLKNRFVKTVDKEAKSKLTDISLFKILQYGDYVDLLTISPEDTKKIQSSFTKLARPDLDFTFFEKINKLWVKIFNERDYDRMLKIFYDKSQQNIGANNIEDNEVLKHVSILINTKLYGDLTRDILKNKIEKKNIKIFLNDIKNKTVNLGKINYSDFEQVLYQLDHKTKIEYAKKIDWTFEINIKNTVSYLKFLGSMIKQTTPLEFDGVSKEFGLNLGKYLTDINSLDGGKVQIENALGLYKKEFIVLAGLIPWDQSGNNTNNALTGSLKEAVNSFILKNSFSKNDLNVFISYLKSDYFKDHLNKISKNNLLQFITKQKGEMKDEILKAVLKADDSNYLSLEILKQLKSHSYQLNTKMKEFLYKEIDIDKMLLLEDWKMYFAILDLNSVEKDSSLLVKLISHPSVKLYPKEIWNHIDSNIMFLIKNKFEIYDQKLTFYEKSFFIKYFKEKSIFDLYAEDEVKNIFEKMPVEFQKEIIIPQNIDGQVDKNKFKLMLNIVEKLPNDYRGKETLNEKLYDHYLTIIEQYKQSFNNEKIRTKEFISDVNGFINLSENPLIDILYLYQAIKLRKYFTPKIKLEFESIVNNFIDISHERNTLKNNLSDSRFVQILVVFDIDVNSQKILQKEYIKAGYELFGGMYYSFIRESLNENMLSMFANVLHAFTAEEQKTINKNMQEVFEAVITESKGMVSEGKIPDKVKIYLSFSSGQEDFNNRKKTMLDLLSKISANIEHKNIVNKIFYQPASQACSGLDSAI